MRATKNIGKSVRERLFHISKREGYEFEKLLIRYLHERFIYRMSISQYRNNFMLKGGSLLYAYNGLKNRPTKDIDFLAKQISNDPEHMKHVVAEISQTPYKEDGVVFDSSTITADSIMEEHRYEGIRISIAGHLDKIMQQLSFDIGFGDVVVPSPVEIDYPVFLDTMPPISILAYSLETVIAEKFQTMIVRDTENSRMKDFFDCYQLLKYRQDLIDYAVLGDAIKSTFEKRKTLVPNELKLFTEAFALDEKRNRMWKNYLKKIDWGEDISFIEVMNVIRNSLQKFV